nr:MAG TPA: hypothetical protein [Herelleviridae sp.]
MERRSFSPYGSCKKRKNNQTAIQILLPLFPSDCLINSQSVWDKLTAEVH